MLSDYNLAPEEYSLSRIASIRAYGAQEAFKKELFERVDKYSRVYIMHENFNRRVPHDERPYGR